MATGTDQEVVVNVLNEMCFSATDLLVKAEHVMVLVSTMSLDEEGNDYLFAVSAKCQEITSICHGKLLRWMELSSSKLSLIKCKCFEHSAVA